MGPHAENLDGVDFWENLVDEAMLDVAAAGIGAGQVAHEFFKRWRRLEGIFFEDMEECGGPGLEA